MVRVDPDRGLGRETDAERHQRHRDQCWHCPICHVQQWHGHGASEQFQDARGASGAVPAGDEPQGVKFSKNWHKAKAKVQRLHTPIANARRDILHKATTSISQNHAVVWIEDVQIRNMSKSRRCRVETPRRNVRATSGLNTSTRDQGWAELRRRLDSKMAWSGRWHMAVPPHTGAVQVRRMRLCEPRRPGRRDQHHFSPDATTARRRAGHGRRFCQVPEYIADRL